MLVLKPVKKEKRLILGNYVNVHVMAVNANQTHLDTMRIMKMQREELIRRVEKERPELREVRCSKAKMINKGNWRREVLPNTLLERKAG